MSGASSISTTLLRRDIFCSNFAAHTLDLNTVGHSENVLLPPFTMAYCGII